MDTMLNTAGALLRRWRLVREMTQAELGKRAGFHHTVISKLESDTRSPTLSEVERLSRALRCKPRDLVPDRHARNMRQS